LPSRCSNCRRIESGVRAFCVDLPQGLDHGLMYGGNGCERPAA
jgi:hypothetical protein